MSEDLNVPHSQGKIASSSKRVITAILYKGSGLAAPVLSNSDQGS